MDHGNSSYGWITSTSNCLVSIRDCKGTPKIGSQRESSSWGSSQSTWVGGEWGLEFLSSHFKLCLTGWRMPPSNKKNPHTFNLNQYIKNLFMKKYFFIKHFDASRTLTSIQKVNISTVELEALNKSSSNGVFPTIIQEFVLFVHLGEDTLQKLQNFLLR